jgi:hypothetical protein
MTGQDRLEVERVLPGTRVEPALVALVAIVALVGAATWKPWADPDDATTTPIGPVPAQAAAQSLVTTTPAPTAEAVVLGPTGVQPIAALNLSTMGVADSHEGWGVSVAYLPITNIAVATRKRLPSVTPMVEWTAVEPDRPVELPAAVPAIATVAVAVTWPSSPPPRNVRLFYLGRAPEASEGREVDLLRPLPRIVTLARRGGREHFHPSERVAWPYLSGVFYLPPSGSLPARPRDWLSSGWPAGEYEFRVTRADGGIVHARFLLGGSASSPPR